MKVAIRLTRSLLSIAALPYIVLAMPAAALAALLVIKGETAQGRLFGLAAILAFPAPVLLWRLEQRPGSAGIGQTEAGGGRGEISDGRRRGRSAPRRPPGGWSRH